MNHKIILIMLFILYGSLQAQMDSSWSLFFPHHIGDVWQYRSFYTNEVVSTQILDRDSSDQLGNIFLWYHYKEGGAGIYKIDTGSNVYALYSVADTGNLPLLYKLNADTGAEWTYLSQPAESVTITAKIISVFSSTVFGRPVVVKKIDYVRNSVGGSPFWIGDRYLATGFGLIQWDIEPSDIYFLAGAIIDSIQYGNINGVKEPSIYEMEYTLSQNYPNPFNPWTTIEFYLPYQGEISLEVVNILGERVKMLIRGFLMPGKHTATFDGSGLPSGLYLYRLQTSDGTLTKKMMLLR